MRIAIISDIHDNIWALAKVLEKIQDCDALLCLGDLCAPFTIAQIRDGFAKQVYVVWGNNDGDKVMVASQIAQGGHVHHLGDVGQIKAGGRRIAMTHYPHIANMLAQGQTYDLVCHGHDHERAQKRVGNTLVLNPGEVMGRLGVTSWAVYDTSAGEAEIVILPASE